MNWILNIFFDLISSAEVPIQNQHVIEKEIMSINSPKLLEQNSTSSNVRLVKDSVILRSSKGEGSIINLKEEVETNNWSVEFMVKNLVLKDVERAGLYLWYTDKQLDKGRYKGGSNIFNGFITGIEFSKDRADIVFAFNYGLDFENKDLQTMKFDHINPNLIDHLDNFKVKIIHTEKNFKIELYDEHENLLSDSFRIHEPLIMNKDILKKNFAITTKYEHCPSEIYLELKDLKIFSREETEHYDIRDLHTDYNQHPRNKGDDEIRLAIADINHFLTYLTIVLGSKNKNSIIEMVLSVKKKLVSLRDSFDSLSNILNDKSSQDSTVQDLALNTKIGDLEKITEELNQKLEKTANKLKSLKMNEYKDNSIFQKWIVGLSIVFLGVSVLKIVLIKVFSGTKSSKKE